jgi:hypothetical protein
MLFVTMGYCLAWFLFLILRLYVVPNVWATLSGDIREAGRFISVLAVSLCQRKITAVRQRDSSLLSGTSQACVPQFYVGWLFLHSSSTIVYFVSSSIMWATVHWTGIEKLSKILLPVFYALTRLTFALSLFVISSGLAFTRLNPVSGRIRAHLALTLSERRAIFLLTLLFTVANSLHSLLHTSTTFFAVLFLDIIFYKAQFAHILHNTVALNGILLFFSCVNNQSLPFLLFLFLQSPLISKFVGHSTRTFITACL